MQRTISSMRFTIAAIASVLMLIAIVPINVSGDYFGPAGDNSTQGNIHRTPGEGCPPAC